MVLVSSCSKDEIIFDYHIQNVGSNGDTKFQSITYINDSIGYLVGGNRGVEGYIYKTLDGGITWDLNYATNNSIFHINFINDSVGYACGENLLLLQTINQGKSWKLVNFPYYPPQEYYVVLRSIEFQGDSLIFLSGGKYFDHGVIATSVNAGNWWNWYVFNFEISDSHFFTESHGIFSGYGQFMKTTNKGESYENIDFKGDFFVSMFFLNDQNGFAVGYDGGIYRTSTMGDNWDEIVNTNNLFKERIHLNDIYMINTNKGIAVGNEGKILITYDGGSNWSKSEIEKNQDLLSAYYHRDGYVWITCSNGKLLKLKI